MLGSSVAAGLTPGPWYVRLFAAFCGVSAALVFTPVFSPLAVALFTTVYTWAGVDVSQVPVDSVEDVTFFVMGLVGIDACRMVIDRGKMLMSKLPVPWNVKPKS
jgi:hypothetical protein